jgi:hypothetical protein
MAYEREVQGATDGRRQIGSVSAAKGGFSRKRRDAALTCLNGSDLDRLPPDALVAVDKRGNVRMAVYYRKTQ